MNNYKILLGGIGGDSHSVGISILKQSLLNRGYSVSYLSNNNSFKDFVALSKEHHLILISCMDGHAKEYVGQIVKNSDGPNQPIWYIGGNLSVSNQTQDEEILHKRGFDRVFMSFVDLDTILKTISKDLSVSSYVPVEYQIKDAKYHLNDDAVYNNYITKVCNNSFQRDRNFVLNTWETGKRAKSFNENAAFLQNAPNFSIIQKSVAHNANTTLLQPRCGVGSISTQEKIFNNFKLNGVKVLSYQIDSLTRK